MCFYINKNYKNIIRAEKNIICYKVTYNGKVYKDFFKSMFKEFIYKYNTTYKLNKTLIIEDGNVIEEGFHSYSNYNKAKRVKNNYSNSNGNNSTIRCIIPKDALYYFNPDENEYVSDQIIIGKHKYNNKKYLTILDAIYNIFTYIIK